MQNSSSNDCIIRIAKNRKKKRLKNAKKKETKRRFEVFNKEMIAFLCKFMKIFMRTFIII